MAAGLVLMADPTLLFVKPKSVSQKDKKSLSDIGVVVVEVDDPSSPKLVRPAVELASSDLLGWACGAILKHSCDSVRTTFGRLIAEELVRRVGTKSG